MSPIDKSILERIQKLHAHAVSARAIGSEQEAIAFLEGVEKLLNKYQLSMTDVEFKLELESDPVESEFVKAERVGGREGGSRLASWQINLAGAVIRHHSCQIILATGTNAFWIVGRTANRRVAEFMYAALRQVAEQLATKAYGERYKQAALDGDVTAARGYRASFLTAFSLRVMKRYVDLAKESNELTAEERGVALVRTNLEKELIDKFMAEQQGLQSRARSIGSTRNADGYADGDSAGKKVSLNANGLDAGGSSKSVSAGQLRLGSGS